MRSRPTGEAAEGEGHMQILPGALVEGGGAA